MKDLNLIPKSYILKKKQKRKKVLLIISVFFISIIFIAVVAAPIKIKMDLQARKNSLDKNIKSMSGYIDLEKQLNAIEDIYNKRLEEGNNVNNSGINVAESIEKIEAVIPKKLFVTSFSAGSSKDGEELITLIGVAQTENEVASFVNRLRKDSYFKSVVITSVVKTGAVSAAGAKTGVSEVPNIGGLLNINEGYNFTINLYI